METFYLLPSYLFIIKYGFVHLDIWLVTYFIIYFVYFVHLDIWLIASTTRLCTLMTARGPLELAPTAHEILHELTQQKNYPSDPTKSLQPPRASPFESSQALSWREGLPHDPSTWSPQDVSVAL